MKRILFAILASVATLSISSCGTGLHMSNAVNQFGTQTIVTLSQPNFRIVRNVEAVIEVNNYNLKRTDVEKSAYAQLLKNADLQGSQALINVVVEEVRRTKQTLLCGPKHKQYVAARATIIEFIDSPAGTR